MSFAEFTDPDGNIWCFRKSTGPGPDGKTIVLRVRLTGGDRMDIAYAGGVQRRGRTGATHAAAGASGERAPDGYAAARSSAVW
jgi:hypothetical protein